MKHTWKTARWCTYENVFHFQYNKDLYCDIPLCEEQPPTHYKSVHIIHLQKNMDLPSVMSITKCMENIQEQEYITEKAYQSAVCWGNRM